MPEIKNLLETCRESVWFYIEEESRADFYRELEENKCHFSNGRITEESIGPLMAVHRDGTAAYISGMAWAAMINEPRAFSDPYAILTPLVNYQKYCRGDADYIIKRKCER